MSKELETFEEMQETLKRGCTAEEWAEEQRKWEELESRFRNRETK